MVTGYVDPFDPATWPDYDEAQHQTLLGEFCRHAGFEWLEGEEIPSTDQLMIDFEQAHHVVLPERAGPALAKVRRFVRRKFNDGKNDVPT